MASSVSGQDEPNSALRLATREGKMALSYRSGLPAVSSMKMYNVVIWGMHLSQKFDFFAITHSIVCPLSFLFWALYLSSPFAFHALPGYCKTLGVTMGKA